MTATKSISLYAAERPVNSVTIFQSSIAQITRSFSVALSVCLIGLFIANLDVDYPSSSSQRGKNELEISGISNLVDAESPRIHGLGSDVRVFAISCTKHLARAPGVRRSKNAARLKEIAAKKKALEAERTVFTEAAALLDDMVRAAMGSNSGDGGGPAQLGAMMEDLVRRKREAATGVLGLEREIAALDEEQWMLNNTHRGETTTVVSATVVAKRDCELEFQMTYRECFYTTCSIMVR